MAGGCSPVHDKKRSDYHQCGRKRTIVRREQPTPALQNEQVTGRCWGIFPPTRSATTTWDLPHPRSVRRLESLPPVCLATSGRIPAGPCRSTTRTAPPRPTGKTTSSAPTQPATPLEDWAESWAHFMQHERDALETAAAVGPVFIEAQTARMSRPMKTPPNPLSTAVLTTLSGWSRDWLPLTYVLNNLKPGVGVGGQLSVCWLFATCHRKSCGSSTDTIYG